MNTDDFARLRESTRQMVAIKKKGEDVPQRTFRYEGKVLIEIRENGRCLWHISDAARELAPRIAQQGDAAPDAKMIREALNQSQEGFAELLGISVGTLRGWEQGRRTPRGPSRVLLGVAARHPEAVLDTAHDLQAA